MLKRDNTATEPLPCDIGLNQQILKLLHDERQLDSRAVQSRLSTRTPAEVMNALTNLKDTKLVESHNWAPPGDLHILTANGERRVRGLMGLDVPELERKAAIALLETASRRPVSSATTLPGVGPAMARDIFSNLSERNRYLTSPTADDQESSIFVHVGLRLLGVPSSMCPALPQYQGHVITSAGRAYLKTLKAQL